jgi:hypothetical protein
LGTILGFRPNFKKNKHTWHIPEGSIFHLASTLSANAGQKVRTILGWVCWLPFVLGYMMGQVIVIIINQVTYYLLLFAIITIFLGASPSTFPAMT